VPVHFSHGTIEIEPSNIEPAIIDVEHAMTEQKPTATIAEVEIPANNENRDALLEARAVLDERANREILASEPNAPKPQTRERIGLQVHRNFDEAEYRARRTERSRVIFELPKMASLLKEHQTEAVRWLQQRWANGRRGALLADDMGLGKTLSALAFMIWLRAAMQARTIPPRPILIVAPVSLLDNWQAEHKRHIGSSPNAFVDIVKAYGSH
jgi:SNF2 family DNA or RNA helicase